jgi:hypothetical protein
MISDLTFVTIMPLLPKCGVVWYRVGDTIILIVGPAGGRMPRLTANDGNNFPAGHPSNISDIAG